MYIALNFFFVVNFICYLWGFFTLKGKEAENTSLREERIANIMKKIRDQKKACAQPQKVMLCYLHWPLAIRVVNIIIRPQKLMSWSSIHAKYFINIVHQVAACLVLGGGPDPLKCNSNCFKQQCLIMNQCIYIFWPYF